MCTHEDQRLVLVPSTIILHFKHSLSEGASPNGLGYSANHEAQRSACVHHLNTKITDRYDDFSSYMGSGHMISGPHACITGT